MPEKFDFSKTEDQKEFKNLPRDEKEKIIGEAQEEAEVENLEKELSPEIVEKIMDEVQDINKEGTAFTVIYGDIIDKSISDDVIKSVLQHGILGGELHNVLQTQENPLKNLRKQWAESVRKRPKQRAVHFNIIGRSHIHETKKDPDTINNSYYMLTERERVAIIFDLSAFKEEEPAYIQEPGKEFKNRTYRAFGAYGPGRYIINDQYEKPMPSDEWGFILSSRVPPKFFKGLILKAGVEKENRVNWLRRRTEELSNLMRNMYDDKYDLLLPIYDDKGNLYWPKKINYEEVKKFVAERDKKKEEK